MNYTEHELCVLGSMMIDPSCIDDVRAMLTSSNFVGTGHRELFTALCDCYEDKGEALDFVLLRNQLEQQGTLQDVGGVDYLVKVGEEVPSAASVEYYAELVIRDGKRREVLAYAENAVRDVTNETVEPGSVASELMTQMEQVLSRSTSGKNIKIDDIRQRGIELCEGTYIPSIPTGISVLDDHFGGFTKSEMTIIAARPGMGKTALALQIIMDLAERGVKVGFFSVEMPKIQLYDRMIQFHSGQSVKEIKEKHRFGGTGLFPDQIKKIKEAVGHIETKIAPNLWVDDTGSLTVDQIEMRLCKADNFCDVLFIDHLQELSIPHKQNRAIDLGHAVDRIKQTGRDKRHTVLLCQLNRNLVGRTSKEPNMSDLKESGKTEEAANNIVFIHNEDYYHKGESDYKNKNHAKIIIGKARDGDMGHGMMKWIPELTKFSDTWTY